MGWFTQIYRTSGRGSRTPRHIRDYLLDPVGLELEMGPELGLIRAPNCQVCASIPPSSLCKHDMAASHKHKTKSVHSSSPSVSNDYRKIESSSPVRMMNRLPWCHVCAAAEFQVSSLLYYLIPQPCHSTQY